MHEVSDSPFLGFTQVTQHILIAICPMKFSGAKFYHFLINLFCWLAKFGVSSMDSWRITATYMVFFMVPSFYSVWLTNLQTRFTNASPSSPHFGFAIQGLSSEFQPHFFLSKHSALFPRLIYKCFVTFFNKYFWLYFGS